MTEAAPAPSHFGDYQNEIYFAGLGGQLPKLPLTPAELEAAARGVMSAEAFGYVAGSAGTEITARANRAAFDRYEIVPRLLRDVSVRSQATTVLGSPMRAPVVLAPVGVQSIVHPDAEVAVARAAAALGLVSTLSTVSSHPMEAVAEAGTSVDPAAHRWFQLYWPRDPDVAASLLARAKAAGYRTLVVTLDTFTLAWRPRDLVAAYLPFLHRLGLANYETDPAFLAGLTASPEEDPGSSVLRWASMFGDPTKTWADLPWLREHWDGPIALKGILHPDDARRAVDAGMDGLIVSNHGGRQIDGETTSLRALPAVLDAVGSRAQVLLDSGVRTGSDVVKAIALGARAVLLGRPYVYGLALGGEAGVTEVLRGLLADLDLTMALAGCATLADIGLDTIVPAER